ncbi:MAG TPA: L-threonylcarbamoyladenylate synthase [Ktedonobacteraceae bacterium]|nr:L-threonylcarbamoyladenylate synthase [Ktedonobacteraceae bacterium]
MPDEIQTEVVQVDALRPEPSIIERAAGLLRAGNVVVFPTETVYGLGADVFQPAALERIFVAKERPHSDPLIAHIADEASLELLTTTLSKQAKRLTSVFWPGPLTLILPRGPRVPHLITAGLETVAVRMPRHPVALALIRALGSPIAAPSANRFMHVSPTSARHVLSDLAGRVPLILDGGPCEVGVESTVLDLCSEPPTILRPGGVSLEALRAVVPDVQPPRLRKMEDTAHPDENDVQAQHSPGQMLTHYAPAIPLLLYDGSAESMRAAMLAEARQRLARGERIGLLVADEDEATFQHSGVLVCSPGSATDSAQIAASLFRCLRTLEDARVQVILCRQFDDRGLGLAIRDRLLKAAGGRVIQVKL